MMIFSLRLVKSVRAFRISCSCFNHLASAPVFGRSQSRLTNDGTDCEEEEAGTSPQTPDKISQKSYAPPKQRIARANDFFKGAGKRAFLQKSAYKPEQSPALVLPEIAFLGRTSVGKSSLINALLNTKKLARTAKMPGRTRLVNFFNIENRMYLVDLPGYGYAPGLGRDGHYFVKVAEKYLEDRKKHKLRNICLLIDGEVGVKKNDLIAFEMLEEFGIPFQVVMTKVDKASQEVNDLVLRQVHAAIYELTTICLPHVFTVSAKKKTGLGELRCFIAESAGILKSRRG